MRDDGQPVDSIATAGAATARATAGRIGPTTAVQAA
jgi:hypothetical protein